MLQFLSSPKKGPGGVILPGLFIILLLGSLAFSEEKSLPQVERMALLKRFVRAQSTEIKKVQAKQKKELTHLASSQKARKKEWMEKEKEARRKYMKSGVKMKEVQAYIKDYFARKQAMSDLMEDEKKKRILEQGVFSDSLKADQGTKLQQFKEFLNKGEKPPENLWPQVNSS